ncbi:glycosyl hydrolase [uncultured Draconibacterium sp.]|uniref:glycosyl hydrolase n=1 Tax=uncultured Draconibacterium sp. TaxID=1573823 RepID=UPI003217E729
MDFGVLHIQSIKYVIPLFFIFLLACGSHQPQVLDDSSFTIKTDDTLPWVYWFLTDASISEKGITTDLEAMKENGIGGAYLFTIRGAANPSLYEPTTVQLTPEWWDLMKYAITEANRLGLKLGIHACDGFTAAGGPWITPELSMQKVVWADTLVPGNQHFENVLPEPEKVENYYKDIATFAYPAPEGFGISSYTTIPDVSSSIAGKEASFLVVKGNTKDFTSKEECWIQYHFEEPFTCRSVTLQSGWNNYQANRLIIKTSNDGKTFKRHGRLDEYRHGWDDRGESVTHLIEPLTANYFRFVFDPAGTEPGAEDLDDAKWKPRLKVSGIELSGEAKIHQFEGKSGAVWRISKSSYETFLPVTACVDPEKLINLTAFLDEEGILTWDVPEGNWVILRMGHTSTGLTNYVGGGAVGLECDKLNPAAVKIQFENWFDTIYNHVDTKVAKNVIEELYNDSWECGSQNWSPVFPDEFQKRRGYDLMAYLPVMAGVPLKNVESSEQVLYDIRETIAEVLVDNYHDTMKKLAHEKGCRYSAECIAPVFVSDGMLHYKFTDAPTGEFWFRSPSHDKPNDVLDAVSGAHIYGKKLARAEAGTEIRLDWDEHPGILKTLFDRNFAIGINKIIFHVFAHDPWITRKPGKTVGVVGQFFQPNQTWWKPGKAWVKYIENCQTLLQKGAPVVDIAVFTGEEIPRRAILPDRLVPVLPGIFGDEKVEAEKQRLENTGQPFHQQPKGVTTLKNLADPLDWIDPLNGYAYDSFNKDVLVNRAKVKNGRIELPGGASYALLVIPGKRKMNPEAGMSLEVAKQILKLVKDGATIYFQEKPTKCLGPETDKKEFEAVINELFSNENATTISENLDSLKIGKGQVLTGKYDQTDFVFLGVEKDFYAFENEGIPASKIAWNHRTDNQKEIYFISNQEDYQRDLQMSFRVTGKQPQLYYPVSGKTTDCNDWRIEKGRTIIPFQFENNESVFVIFEKAISETVSKTGEDKADLLTVTSLEGDWELEFDALLGGPEKPVVFEELSDWSLNQTDGIKYYSGTAVYRKLFEWKEEIKRPVYLDLGEVNNLAEVIVNGINCGVAWTAPFRVEITEVLKSGTNELEIAVTNTWANRLIGDHDLPEEKQVTWTNAPYRLEGQPLLKAGLLGPVTILNEKD